MLDSGVGSLYVWRTHCLAPSWDTSVSWLGEQGNLEDEAAQVMDSFPLCFTAGHEYLGSLDPLNGSAALGPQGHACSQP